MSKSQVPCFSHKHVLAVQFQVLASLAASRGLRVCTQNEDIQKCLDEAIIALRQAAGHLEHVLAFSRVIEYGPFF